MNCRGGDAPKKVEEIKIQDKAVDNIKAVEVKMIQKNDPKPTDPMDPVDPNKPKPGDKDKDLQATPSGAATI